VICLVSKYPRSALLGFVTKHACDRQTDGQNYDSQDRASIAASRGKNQWQAKMSATRSTAVLLCLRSDIVIFGHVNRFSYLLTGVSPVTVRRQRSCYWTVWIKTTVDRVGSEAHQRSTVLHGRHDRHDRPAASSTQFYLADNSFEFARRRGSGRGRGLDDRTPST